MGDNITLGYGDHSPSHTRLSTRFLIVGGLYSVTALRRNNEEGAKVYTKHQDLTQASKHHKQMTMRYSPLRRVSASSSSSESFSSSSSSPLSSSSATSWSSSSSASSSSPSSAASSSSPSSNSRRERERDRSYSVPRPFFDCWWALFGNRAAEKQRRRGDSVY